MPGLEGVYNRYHMRIKSFIFYKAFLYFGLIFLNFLPLAYSEYLSVPFRKASNSNLNVKQKVLLTEEKHTNLVCNENLGDERQSCSSAENKINISHIIKFAASGYQDRVILGKASEQLQYQLNLVVAEPRKIILKTIISHFIWSNPSSYALILSINKHQISSLVLLPKTASNYVWESFIPIKYVKNGINILTYALSAKNSYKNSRSFKDWLVIHADSFIEVESLKPQSAAIKLTIKKPIIPEQISATAFVNPEKNEKEKNFFFYHHGTIIFLIFVALGGLQLIISLYFRIRQKLTKK